MTMQARGFLAILIRQAVIPVAAACLFVLAAPLRAQESVATLDPVQTRVEFTLGDVLHTVHGAFKLKSGTVHFDPVTGKAGGAIIIDATTGDSGSKSRDRKMHKEILESREYPEIVFTPIQVRGSLSPQGSSQVEVSGLFRLHGQDHDMTLTLVVQKAGDRVEATTQFIVPYVKWGLKNPSTFILRVDDKVQINVHAVGQLTSAPPQP
jgi:polyisoprenoid-binding protein YceI